MELLKTKLNKANGILAKIRHFVNKNLLRTIYFAVLTHIFVMDVRFEDKKIHEKSKA